MSTETLSRHLSDEEYFDSSLSQMSELTDFKTD